MYKEINGFGKLPHCQFYYDDYIDGSDDDD